MTASITKVGGAQLYTNSKRQFMEARGWKVDVVSSSKGTAMLPELTQYQYHINEDLEVFPYHYTKHKCKSILKRIEEKFEGNNEIIIESHNTIMHVWGELLAFRLQAKHVVYEITERSRCTKGLYPFFKFKFERKEMAGIQDSSLNYYFKGFMDVPVSQRYCLIAHYFSKQVDDVPYDTTVIPVSSAMCTIGILGRLQKPFVMEVAKQVSEYVKNDTNNKYTVIIIGGQKDGDSYISNIESLFSGISNVNLFFTGYLFPIPQKLVSLIDIGISSSGAVITLANEGVPTIAIDAHDLQPLGVYGITTDDVLYRKDDTIVPLSEWIKRIQTTPDAFRMETKQVTINEDVFNHHLDFINNSSKEVEYYTDFRRSSQIINRLLVTILGAKVFRSLRKNIKRTLLPL